MNENVVLKVGEDSAEIYTLTLIVSENSPEVNTVTLKVKEEHIEINSREYYVGKKGDSAFEVWNENNGGGNLYQDWIDYLREPADLAKIEVTEAITASEKATQDALNASNDYTEVVKPDILVASAYAEEKGNYANTQGNYARAQGEKVAEKISGVSITEEDYLALSDKDDNMFYFIIED